MNSIIIRISKKNRFNIFNVLIPYRNKSKWGFCSLDKTILVRCNYDSVEFFKGGVAKVKIGKFWGIINQAGCQILPCIYDSIEILGPYFDKTYLCVKDDSTDKYGLFNSIGFQIIPFTLESE